MCTSQRACSDANHGDEVLFQVIGVLRNHDFIQKFGARVLSNEKEIMLDDVLNKLQPILL